MKFLAITALLVAGTLAMPASNSCSPPGGDHKPPPPPSHPSPSPTPSYPPPPNNGGGYYPPPPDNTSHTPPPPSSTPPNNGGGGNDGGSGNTGGGNSDDGSDGGHSICPSGLYSSLQCCSVDVLEIADLNCEPPSTTPKDGSDFAKICSSTGSKARCCVIPVAGQALLCEDVVGAN